MTKFRYEIPNWNIDSEEFKELDKLAEESKNLVANIIEEETSIIEKLLIESFRNMIPPLKGKITKGKLRWRGITLGVRKSFLEYWIMQRGKQISPTLKIIREIDAVNSKYITKYQFLKNEGKQWDL